MGKTAMLLLALYAMGGTVTVSALQADANPLSKVYDLMDELVAKINSEGEAEAKAYKEYFAWCDDMAKNSGFEIKTTEAKKDDAAAEYAEMTQENKVTKTMKDQDLKYKTKEVKGLKKAIADLSSDRDTLGSELSAVNEYYAKLKDRCVAKPETYEERKARREAEINGLKEALNILE